MSTRESKPQTCPAALTAAGQHFNCDQPDTHVTHTNTVLKARWVDDRHIRRLSILAVFGALLAATTLSTGVAKADPQIDQYVINNASVVCQVLDDFPSVEGVEGVMEALFGKGLTPRQAGEVVARSTIGWCPDHVPEVDAFITKWAPVGMVRA